MECEHLRSVISAPYEPVFPKEAGMERLRNITSVFLKFSEDFGAAENALVFLNSGPRSFSFALRSSLEGCIMVEG